MWLASENENEACSMQNILVYKSQILIHVETGNLVNLRITGTRHQKLSQLFQYTGFIVIAAQLYSPMTFITVKPVMKFFSQQHLGSVT